MHKVFGESNANGRTQDFDFLGVGRDIWRSRSRNIGITNSESFFGVADCLLLYGYPLRVLDCCAPPRLGPSQILAGVVCRACPACASCVFRDSRVSSDESGISRYYANGFWRCGRSAYFRFLVESLEEEVDCSGWARITLPSGALQYDTDSKSNVTSLQVLISPLIGNWLLLRFPLSKNPVSQAV